MQKNCKTFGSTSKVVSLYLERLPKRQIILHNLANAIREAHAEKSKRNLCMSMHQAQLIEVMSYSRRVLEDSHQHTRVKPKYLTMKCVELKPTAISMYHRC